MTTVPIIIVGGSTVGATAGRLYISCALHVRHCRNSTRSDPLPLTSYTERVPLVDKKAQTKQPVCIKMLSDRLILNCQSWSKDL
jgi:hypothetical protein